MDGVVPLEPTTLSTHIHKGIKSHINLNAAPGIGFGIPTEKCCSPQSDLPAGMRTAESDLVTVMASGTAEEILFPESHYLKHLQDEQ